MRRAAQEAETMANLMSDPSIPNEAKTAFQQRNADFARLLTSTSTHAVPSSSLPPPPSTTTAAYAPPATTMTGSTSPSSEGSPTLGPAGSAVPAPSKKRSRASEGPALIDEDGKKKRKKREPKDPNAPKRPASAYILYQNEVRAKFREEHPQLSYRELLPEIAKAWQNLDPVEKQRYQDIVDKGKAVYTVQKKAYDMAHGGVGSPTTTAPSIVPPPTTTLRVPSASAHHPSLMAPLNGGGMTPSSSHSHQSSEDEDDDDEDEVHPHSHAHAHSHYHHQQRRYDDEEEEEEEDEEEEEEQPPMKKYKSHQMIPPIATV
ncbi:hypothetical protein FRB90_006042 [Tulasnella sp. 427]|nr:hypothetical protein FRB90_006042 [Tulasnella sp. 427]